MKKLSLLFFALAIASMAMAESVSVTLASGVHGNDQIVWTEVNGNILLTQLQGTSGTAVSSSYVANPRVYKGHILKFEGLNNYMIDSVLITFEGSYYGNSMTAGIAVSSSNVVTDDATAVGRTFEYKTGGTHTLRSVSEAGLSVFYLQNVASGETKQLRVKTLTIYYTKPVVTDPTIDASGFNFKTIPANATDISATIAVEGQNLTEAISYSLVNNNVFAVTGDLTTDGGNLTVNVNPTAAGVFADTIVLTSTGATKKVALDVKVVATTGDGSQDNPFTTKDVRALNNEYAANKWVVGTIAGYLTTSGFSNAVADAAATNIVLVTGKDTISVALPTGDIRTALNLKDNPTLLGRGVKILGSLEAYFSMPGVKNATDYELLPAEESPVANIEGTTDKAVKFVRNGQLYIRKNGVVYNALGAIVEE